MDSTKWASRKLAVVVLALAVLVLSGVGVIDLPSDAQRELVVLVAAYLGAQGLVDTLDAYRGNGR